MIHFTEENFDSYLKESKLPILIDFWAEWCGPCKAIAPVVEEIATEYEGRAIVGKVDVDEAPEISVRYGIRNIPTLIYIKNGEVVDKQVGAVQKKNLTDKLNAIL
ncbi:thioredoxin [Bacteroidia bacterium]|nr:thioredoxin [Bacteroidia bacterium]